VPEPALPAAPQPSAEDDVMRALREMSYGIVSELQKPVANPQATPRPQTAATRPAAEQGAPSRTYTVQAGDSLPGIAFRFYGTTVAYLQILEANRDLLTDPSQLSAGMTLRIPALR